MLKAQVIGRDSVAQTRKQRLKSWMLVAPWNYLGISLSQVLVRNMGKMQTITHSNITFVSLSNSLCLTESCQIYEINMTMAGFGVGGSNLEIPSHHIPGVAWIQTTFCHNHITNSSFLQLNFSISCNSMGFTLPSEMSCSGTHHLAISFSSHQTGPHFDSTHVFQTREFFFPSSIQGNRQHIQIINVLTWQQTKTLPVLKQRLEVHLRF